jgi:hypothetical protein
MAERPSYSHEHLRQGRQIAPRAANLDFLHKVGNMSLLLLLFLAGAPDGSATMASGSSPSVADSGSERKICKRVPMSGTLAGYQRICRTKAEWQQAANRDRDRQAPGAKDEDKPKG